MPHRRLIAVEKIPRGGGHVAVHEGIKLVDRNLIVAVRVGMALQAFVQPPTEQRLLHLAPNQTFFLCLRTGKGYHAFQVAKRLAQFAGGDSRGFLVPLFRARMACVEDQQLEMRPALRDLPAQPLDGNSGCGDVVWIALQGRQVHFSVLVTKTVTAEIHQQAIIRPRPLQKQRQFRLQILLPWPVTLVLGRIDHDHHVLQRVVAAADQSISQPLHVVKRVKQFGRGAIILHADQNRPSAAFLFGALDNSRLEQPNINSQARYGAQKTVCFPRAFITPNMTNVLFPIHGLLLDS